LRMVSMYISKFRNCRFVGIHQLRRVCVWTSWGPSSEGLLLVPLHGSNCLEKGLQSRPYYWDGMVLVWDGMIWYYCYGLDRMGWYRWDGIVYGMVLMWYGMVLGWDGMGWEGGMVCYGIDTGWYWCGIVWYGVVWYCVYDVV
jgi:hypothetical protein